MRILALAAACHRDPDPGPTPTEPGPVAFTAGAEARGYTVQVGAFDFSAYEHCCDPGVSCLWNNPTTPYGAYALPPAPGQTAADPDPREDGLARLFHLRPDEAIVLLGRTPPTVKYFSWRSYLGLRFTEDGSLPVLGSLGPSLNNLVVAEAMGTEDIYDQPFAVVTTVDQAVEDEMVELLADAGWDAATVHPDRIPYELVHLGLDDGDDLIQGVARVAVYADPAEEAAYLADPGATLLRLTPTAPEAPPVAPHAREVLPARGSGTDEAAWIEAVDALSAAIAAANPDRVPVEASSTAWHFETYDCITEDAYCSGEIRDRFYARVPNFLLPEDGSVFAVAFGVNHERVGKAEYANVSIDSVLHQIGIDAIDSDRFVGSARAWLPDHPQVDDLFAVTIARSCAGLPEPCLAVPTGCPGANGDEPVLVSFRAYLEPTTGAAPLAAELVPSRVVLLAPPGSTSTATRAAGAPTRASSAR